MSVVQRSEQMKRAIRIVKLFETNKVITIRDIMRALCCSITSARYWLDVASLELPIYEVGRVKRRMLRGPMPLGYKLLR